jgi:hypothetical protein
MGFVAVGPADLTLQITRMDATGLEGRVFTAKPVARSYVTYAIDATFAMPLGKAVPPAPPVALKISGDVTSPPTAAYAEYYRATQTGDAQKIRSCLAASRVKEFDAFDTKMRQAMLGVMKDNPSEILIGKPAITAGKATFTVDGLNTPSTKRSATVTMVQEGGAWKVDKESWSITSK